MFYQNQNAPTEKLSPNCQMCQLCFKTAKKPKVSVQGIKQLGGHFACFCREFDFYEVKKNILLFVEKKKEVLSHF